MKKIISLILVMIMALSVIACGGGTPATTPKAPEKNPPVEKTEIVFAEGGEVKLSVVLPAETNTGVNHAATRIGIIVDEMIGVELSTGSVGEREYELHLGQTDDKAREIYGALGEDEFAIKTVDKKIYIVAKNDLWLYDSVEYFAEKYLASEEYSEASVNNLKLTGDIDEVAKTDKTSVRYYFSLGKEINATVKVKAEATNTYYAGESTTVPYARQGGCFDGTYMYQALVTKNDECARIMKVNVNTGETTFSEIRTDMKHANSMGYNPDRRELMVGYDTTVFIFNAETLAYKTKITAGQAVSRGITYDPIAHQYVVRWFRFYDKLDQPVVRSFGHDPSINTGNYDAFQGTGCDGYFVTALMAKSGAGTKGGYNCHLAVYATDGTYMGLIKVEIPNGYEPENVSIVDGVFYVTGCTPHPVVTLYEVVFGE